MQSRNIEIVSELEIPRATLLRLLRIMTAAWFLWPSHFDARQVSDLPGSRPRIWWSLTTSSTGSETKGGKKPPASQRLAAHRHGQAITPIVFDPERLVFEF